MLLLQRFFDRRKIAAEANRQKAADVMFENESIATLGAKQNILIQQNLNLKLEIQRKDFLLEERDRQIERKENQNAELIGTLAAHKSWEEDVKPSLDEIKAELEKLKKRMEVK